MRGEHVHDWRAIAWTNLCICVCGARRRWWELQPSVEPFGLRRFVSKDVQERYEREEMRA